MVLIIFVFILLIFILIYKAFNLLHFVIFYINLYGFQFTFVTKTTKLCSIILVRKITELIKHFSFFLHFSIVSINLLIRGSIEFNIK